MLLLVASSCCQTFDCKASFELIAMRVVVVVVVGAERSGVCCACLRASVSVFAASGIDSGSTTSVGIAVKNPGIGGKSPGIE